ncbi:MULTISPECIES: DUF2358 domain-containing protein [Pseudanabaena]|uniref:SnoaL-like domain-containing protein n=2 Tax=Pseudanabaena TaxID=1152 RepID=L8MXH4_9CYAN|nr:MULTISPECIES: DUF2358 domain-containing protein [Pseudanabaena]ELS31160.1 Protein of unknown function DUF2358 [Pseudanabaena biceps PCC 7429]MDG3496570.1 DUF2358 domain-containing protein [Pseudanabaena catenata USMAC16]
MTNILDIIKADYAKFPEAQTYSIYNEDVYFKDPVYNFRGIKQYQKMIGFITFWFKNLKLELHDITRNDNLVKARWTMSWDAPLPWKPRISVTGWSDLTLSSFPDPLNNGESDRELIISHIDYWECTKFDVIKQHFVFNYH